MTERGQEAVRRSGVAQLALGFLRQLERDAVLPRQFAHSFGCDAAFQ